MNYYDEGTFEQLLEHFEIEHENLDEFQLNH